MSADVSNNIHEPIQQMHIAVGDNKGSKAMINILVKTSKRPNFFKTCMESIRSQTYKNIRTIVSCDNDETFEYLKNYQEIDIVRVLPNEEEYAPLPSGYPHKYYRFHANLYLNNLMDKVTEGYIMILDDDDLLMDSSAVETIVDHIESADDLLFWRVRFPNNIVKPEDEYFGKEPVYCHISAIGFSFHSKFKGSYL